MNPSFIGVYMMLLIIVIQQMQRKKQHTAIRKIIENRKRGSIAMTELLMRYIGKECTLYTLNDSVSGVVKAVEGGWAQVDSGREVSAVNLDFVLRVKEKKKKEK